MALTKVSTDGVKDDAITKTKIPANQIEASELADNAVDTNAIADDAVTYDKIQNVAADRILGRPNGAGTGGLNSLTPAEVRTIINVADGATNSTSTTINNNADNRVITGSGTANTLEGESNLTFDGSTVTIGANAPKLKFNELNGDPDYFINANAGELNIHDDTNGSTKLTITPTKTVFPNNNVGIGTTNPSDKLHVHGAAGSAPKIIISEGGAQSAIRATRNSDTNGDLRFQTEISGTLADRMVIDYSGRVGIGTSSPNQKLNVQDTTQHSLIRVVAKNDADAGIDFGDPDDDDIARIRYHNNGNYMSFRVNGTDRLHIQSGGGISFNSDTAAANALDDYEEGTWTPVFGRNTSGFSSLVNGISTLRYTKVGEIVTISGRVAVGNSNSGANGYLRITLPFTAKGGGTGQSDYAHIMINTHDVNLGNDCIQLFAEISGGASTMNVHEVRDDQSWIAFESSQLAHNNNEYFGFVGSYRAT